MKKRGFTLVEFVIAVSIYVIVMLIAIGSFVSINNIRILGSNMKETQQKGRLAMEMISRFAKEANKVILTDEIVSGSGNFATATMQFDGIPPTPSTTTIAKIVGNTLQFCNPTCSEVIDPAKGVTGLQTGSYFRIIGSVPAVLEVNLVLKSGYSSTTKYDDTLILNNSVLLEGLK